MSANRVTQFPAVITAAGGTTRVTQVPIVVTAAGGTTRVTQVPIAIAAAGGMTRITQFFAFIMSGEQLPPPPPACPGELGDPRIDGIAAPYSPSFCEGGSGTLGLPRIGG